MVVKPYPHFKTCILEGVLYFREYSSTRLKSLVSNSSLSPSPGSLGRTHQHLSISVILCACASTWHSPQANPLRRSVTLEPPSLRFHRDIFQLELFANSDSSRHLAGLQAEWLRTDETFRNGETVLEMPLYREIARCIEKEVGKAGFLVLHWTVGVRWNKNPKGKW